MAEPRYRFQEPRCCTLTITWLPEAPDELSTDWDTPLEPPSRHTPPMRPHRHNRPRDVVRHHRKRAIRHAAEVARTVYHLDPDDVRHLAPRWADNLQTCSCPRCGNPRRSFGERTVQELRLAAREAADDAELLPSLEDDATIYWLREWYRNDYPDGPDQWPPLCDECPVVECWEVAGGEACLQAIRRQHRLDLALIDEDAEAYWDLMDSGDVPGEWPPSVPSERPDHDDD